MTSRLDRLLVLLDCGSSPSIRETAARQIAQFAAKSVAKDAGADNVVLQDAPLAIASASTWQGTSSEWSDVMAVVGKIMPYLHSKSFETRTAASSTLSHICQMTPAWTPQSPAYAEPAEPPTLAPEFPPFDVAYLLRTGTLLLGSSGKEYSEPASLGTAADVNRARREAMNRIGLGFMNGVDDDDLELGKELTQGQDLMDVDDEIKPAAPSGTPPETMPASGSTTPALDYDDYKPPGSKASKGSKIVGLERSETTEIISDPQGPDDSNRATGAMSAREMNRLKRKLKSGNSAFVNAAPAAAAPPPNKMRVVPTAEGPRGRVIATPKREELSPGATAAPEKVIIDPSKGGQVEAKEKSSQALALNVHEGAWVWGGALSVLQVDLFSANWEIRHGAAMALREVIRVRGASGGMREGASAEDNFILHEKWCNDLAAKFLCLFVLDRFSDFVSDQMVAPVRETVSQTLAALLTHMPRRAVLHIHSALLDMVQLSRSVGAPPLSNGNGNGNSKSTTKGKGKLQAKDSTEFAWQVRHAGLVGIKYEVAVRPDLFDDPDTGQEVLKGVVNAAVSGFCDPDDDVRSVAATCLTPITSHIVERLPTDVARVLDGLWDCLSDMKDDLSSSVGFVMELLGKLLSFDTAIAVLSNTNSGRSLTELVPILFPFFRHTIPNVRLAVVNTLNNFLNVVNLEDSWLSGPLFRLLFQNLIVEERSDIQNVSLQAWRAAVGRLGSARLTHILGPHVRQWFSLLMTPLGTPIDLSLLYQHARIGADEGYNVDKSILAQDLSLVSTEMILRGRVAASRALAIVLLPWPPQEQDEPFGVPLVFYHESSSMLQQFLTATIVREWAVEFNALSKPLPGRSLRTTCALADAMVKRFFTYLNADPPATYYEMYLVLSRISTECRSLLNAFIVDGKVPAAKIPILPSTIDSNGTIEGAFTIAMAQETVGTTCETLLKAVPKGKRKEIPALQAKQKAVAASIEFYGEIKQQHDARVAAAVAGAVIALREMPPKLNPVIRSVMNGVKHEDNADLQLRAAKSVAAFAAFSAAPGAPRSTAVDKVVKNLSTFVCQDTKYTPVFRDWKASMEGILLVKDSVQDSSKFKLAAKTSEAAPTPGDRSAIIRRGAHAALSEIAIEFGERVFDTLPVLWETVALPLLEAYESPLKESEKEKEQGQTILDCLCLVRDIVPALHPSLHPCIISLFPAILRAVQSKFAIVRQSAALCLASLCDVMTTDAMRIVVEEVVPLLGDATVVTNKQGAIEVIYNVVQLLDVKALPYIIFLVVPVLGRMSDPDDDLRFVATNTFASLVKMVPLEAGLPDPPGFSETLLAKRETERLFLTQLLNGSKVETYVIPVEINAELRKYQHEGVNWLAFLARYQLHGILCDDMGLGKTLQTICILASKHFERSKRYHETNSPDSISLPSLVVCPPTLVGHWYHEIRKYTNTLSPLMYLGSVKERTKLASNFGAHDVVITSYDVVRNDQQHLGKQVWHYCILDEGHVIKNAKAKLTRAVKTLRAQHRLILSGTPIQNNVLELWSLFDFLMPGFLGTESFFNERFGKPITASRDAKSSAKVKEAATLALEALHKQVLPFLLRRLKEEVLSDLPPKIIQDYHCDLSNIQKQLYDAYTNSQAKLTAQATIGGGAKDSGGMKHVFQSLQYLRKICNHPALVLKTPDDIARIVDVGDEPLDLRNISNAPKLEALRQLLIDCGVGNAASDSKDQEAPSNVAETVISQHRVLIFCQMKQMLDIIETDLFNALMPTVAYMRLDGTVDATKRHAIVETFNADPSIDCLLLTTHVGGLGLTLTGADTVIFVEHDWNPMKDLQAMDRAHRIGQKKVVNVYRLITRGTLEEKIMGLQRFKLNIANSVITQQNSGLQSMDTDLVLDLFKRTTDEEDVAAAKKMKSLDGPVSQKNILEGLDDLPPEDEYNFDLSNFLGTLET